MNSQTKAGRLLAVVVAVSMLLCGVLVTENSFAAPKKKKPAFEIKKVSLKGKGHQKATYSISVDVNDLKKTGSTEGTIVVKNNNKLRGKKDVTLKKKGKKKYTATGTISTTNVYEEKLTATFEFNGKSKKSKSVAVKGSKATARSVDEFTIASNEREKVTFAGKFTAPKEYKSQFLKSKVLVTLNTSEGKVIKKKVNVQHDSGNRFKFSGKVSVNVRDDATVTGTASIDGKSKSAGAIVVKRNPVAADYNITAISNASISSSGAKKVKVSANLTAQSEFKDKVEKKSVAVTVYNDDDKTVGKTTVKPVCVGTNAFVINADVTVKPRNKNATSENCHAVIKSGKIEAMTNVIAVPTK